MARHPRSNRAGPRNGTESKEPVLPSSAILERLTRLHPRVIDLTLGRVERLLARLGHPERALPPVVNVAGTNGKGSVIAFLRAILEAAGQRVHVATSPHLVRFNERIRLAGAVIDDATLSALLEECEVANDGATITFFEITMAAAFLGFARTTADWVLLEVGLGGRLDATNVVARPALTAITPVSLDHQHYLGDTLSAIGFEKAGILKPGVTCVLARQASEADRVIRARAAEVGAEIIAEGVDWSAGKTAGGLRFQFDGKTFDLPDPALVGAHQVQNAGHALACARLLPGPPLPDAALAQGLVDVDWPGRLQRLTRGPIAESLPPGWELWLDGGHNPAAGRALADQARLWSDRPLDLVLGMLNNRDPREFMAPLAPMARSVQAVPIPGSPNAHPPEAIAASLAGLGSIVGTAISVGAAVQSLVQEGSSPGRILVCGSLYLIGSVLALGNE